MMLAVVVVVGVLTAMCDGGDVMICAGEQRKLGGVSGCQEDVG